MKRTRLIVADAEQERRAWLRHHVEILWPEARIEELEPGQLGERLVAGSATDAGGGDAASAAAARVGTDLVVLGTRCAEHGEDGTGLETLQALQRLRFAAVPIVVIADGGNELTAIRALRLGASDYLPRRLLDPQRLASTLRRALRTTRTRATPRPVRAPRRRIDPAHLSLPQYSVIHKLGESSRAAVYLTHAAALNREVALKISKPVVEPGERRELERERAAVSSIRDRSVVEIYEYGFHDGHEFLAMEYFPCGDLKARLQHPITVVESLTFAQRICSALQIVHGAGLVHRDLKPPNVMLRADGSIVLIDFGLAQGVAGHTSVTAAGVLRGSPYYMSPEQAQGLPLDGRSDLYSLGVILFEMLSGAKPYSGNSAIEVMQQHVQGPRPKLPPTCAALESLLDRFMARDREQRYEHASTASAALLGAIAQAEETSRLPVAVGE